MITVDTRGHLCPTPLIMAKRAITGSPAGETIEILSDNDIARCNLVEYLAELGYDATCRQSTTSDGTQWCITFTTDGTTPVGDDPSCSVPPLVPSSVATAPAVTDYVVVLKSDLMGSGDAQLGAMLMRACVNSLPELDRLPSAIIMYNAGVRLATSGSDTAATLLQLSALGVAIIVCGTCVDFYGIKEDLAVGQISNMYKINTLVSQAGHVIYP